MSLPLEGLTVVAIEQAVAVPLATRNLADLGARVIKVDRPTAVTSRATTTTSSTAPAPTSSGSTAARSRSRSTSRPTRAATPCASDRPCRRLRPEPRPGAAERLGLGADDCVRRPSGLVVGRAIGYGVGGRSSSARPTTCCPGGGRPDRDHRHPGPTRQDRDPHRRHRVRDVRRPGGAGRAAAPVAHRRGRDDRRVDARRDDRMDGPRDLHADVHRYAAGADGPEPHARSRPTTAYPTATGRC